MGSFMNVSKQSFMRDHSGDTHAANTLFDVSSIYNQSMMLGGRGGFASSSRGPAKNAPKPERYYAQQDLLQAQCSLFGPAMNQPTLTVRRSARLSYNSN